jgi:MFS transporter, DHA1 family, multidrug resistance protein
MKDYTLACILILSLITCCIEIDISVPSFPSMVLDLNVTDNDIQLTIAYNFLGFCLAALFHGPLSENYGRRPVMIWGNLLLLIGAIGCVWAPSLQALLVARFIQGIGASTSAVVVFAIIADRYQGEKSLKLISLMNAIFSILMAIAPMIGSLINEMVGWRGNYSVVAIFSLISWFLLVAKLPETHVPAAPVSVKNIIDDYKTLLFNSHFILSSFIPSLFYGAYLSFVVCSAFLYMETMMIPPLTYALHQGCIIGMFAMVSLCSHRFTQKLGQRHSVIYGTIGSIISSFGLCWISLFDPHSPYGITFFMMTFGAGFALSYPIIFASSLEIFPEIKGTASSAIMAMRALICSSMTALVSYLYNGHLNRVAAVMMIVLLILSLLTRAWLQKNFIGHDL